MSDPVCSAGVPWTPATWDMDWKTPDRMLWAVIVGGFVMCLMAFGIGANDSANSWGTSVGSGAIGLRRALLIGGAMELLGAVTLGYGVSTTIQKGVSQYVSPARPPERGPRHAARRGRLTAADPSARAPGWTTRSAGRAASATRR